MAKTTRDDSYGYVVCRVEGDFLVRWQPVIRPNTVERVLDIPWTQYSFDITKNGVFNFGPISLNYPKELVTTLYSNGREHTYHRSRSYKVGEEPEYVPHHVDVNSPLWKYTDKLQVLLW